MMPELLLTFPSPLVRSPVEEAPGDALSAMCRGMRRSRCHARGRGDSIALRATLEDAFWATFRATWV